MPRYEEIMVFINKYWKSNHHSPSTREIADHLETSTAVVNYYLLRLEAQGLIMPRILQRARTIVPTTLAQAIDNFYDSN